MDKLLQSIKDIQNMDSIYFNYPPVWIVILIVLVLIIGISLSKSKNDDIQALSAFLIFLGLLGLLITSIYFIYPSDDKLNKHLADFKQHQLLPYVENHRQTYEITGYSCEKEKNPNTFNLTKKSRVNVTAYYTDKKGQIQSISGDMVVYRKGNQPMKLQATEITRKLTDEWGAGFYEPVLTIPTDKDFSCGK